MDTINLLREAVTVLSFTAFLGIIAYAVHPGNRKRFEEAARLPFEEDGAQGNPPSAGAQGAHAQRVTRELGK